MYHSVAAANAIILQIMYIAVHTFSSESVSVSTGSLRLVNVESNELKVSPLDMRTLTSL